VLTLQIVASCSIGRNLEELAPSVFKVEGGGRKLGSSFQTLENNIVH